MNTSTKEQFIRRHFEEWGNTLERAKHLIESDSFHLEGMTVLLCHIAALGRARYPALKDWECFKNIVQFYSGKYDLYENIDLLFLYQFPHSKVSDHPKYNQLNSYEEILDTLESAIGTEEQIHGNDRLRYQKRDSLLGVLKNSNIRGFDEDNFMRNIELFSNNQILYEFARCEAVHSGDFPLINIGMTFPDMQRTFTPNHQITGHELVETLSGIVENLKKECIDQNKWPRQL